MEHFRDMPKKVLYTFTSIKLSLASEYKPALYRGTTMPLYPKRGYKSLACYTIHKDMEIYWIAALWGRLKKGGATFFKSPLPKHLFRLLQFT